MLAKPEVFNRRLFLQPSDNYFDRRAVLNPCIIKNNEDYHILYRAVAQDFKSTIGYLRARYQAGNPVVIDRLSKPLMEPENDFEKEGVEDPRLVWFEGEYHLFYTAWDGYHARLGYASGGSVDSMENRRLIGPLFETGEALKIIRENSKLGDYVKRWSEDPADMFLWEKDATILPERVNNKIVMIHRLRPDIQVAYLDSLEQLDDRGFWEDYLRHMDQYRMMLRKEPWEESHIGMGPVPIKTDAGWLMIYHGVTNRPRLTYRAGAALFDLNDPQRLIGKTKEPLFEPVEDWEKSGDVNNVVFPEGLVVHDGILDIFYGGADTVIGVISVRLDQLLDYLQSV
ncbi:MAG: hypothetical protein P9L92_05660 [Candidatus Electryonea clarkiae]|nr:hypothetical protein [Candidatus Electryonea clarkiae]MDP8289328.1 hypothetical protein [Candidatus Electryonea clarkiae]